MRPLNPRALNPGERKPVQKATAPTKPQPKLPKAFRGQDPIQPILEDAPKEIQEKEAVQVSAKK